MPVMPPVIAVLTVAAVMVATVVEIAASVTSAKLTFLFGSPIGLCLLQHLYVSLLMYRLVSGS